MISLFYAYQYLARILPTVIMPDLMEKFQIGATHAGSYNGIYYIGYVLIHIPLGIILDHFSSKKVIPVCIFFTSIGVVPLVYSDSWILSSIGRFTTGVGAAGAALGGFKLIRLYFGEKRFTRVLGYMVTFGLIGAAFCGAFLATSKKLFGWEDTTVMMIVLGLFLAVFSYIIFPNNIKANAEKISIKIILEDLKYILSKKEVCTISIMGGCLIGVLEGFSDAWGVEFLKQVYYLSEETAARINSCVIFGMAAGLIILGYLSEKLKSYYGLVIASAAAMLVAFLLVLTGHMNNIPLLYMLFFIMGIGCAYQLLVISKVALSVPPDHTSLTAAVVNMIMMSFGYLFHTSIGIIMDMTWDGKMTQKGAHIYKAINYQYSLSIVAVGLFLGAIFFILYSKKQT
jgi:predicted MFS family arabinose efflux permease